MQTLLQITFKSFKELVFMVIYLVNLKLRLESGVKKMVSLSHGQGLTNLYVGRQMMIER